MRQSIIASFSGVGTQYGLKTPKICNFTKELDYYTCSLICRTIFDASPHFTISSPFLEHCVLLPWSVPDSCPLGPGQESVQRTC